MIYLGLGSNLGNRYDNILKGYRLLDNAGEIIKYSKVYESKALVYPGDNKSQGDYLNSVISFSSDMPPDKLLTLLKKIEHETGFRSKRKWGERHLDIDILSYHDLTLKTENLTIPHTEITNRSFVLVPLFEVAGNIILAGDNKPLSFYLEKIDISGIKEYKARENKSASFT